jgi:signal transduction histidine kinase
VELAFDAQALEQIAINLIDNAIKYAEGSEPARIELAVREEAGVAGEEGPVAVLAVRDHGPGIPEGEREKVFLRFHRVEREETAHMPGTGIGLALVRELAEAHGGSARAREAEGGGALFEIRLPIGAEASAEGEPEN